MKFARPEPGGVTLNKFVTLVCAFALFFLIGANVQAQNPQHGIAMHGAPKYERGFTHLDYVNPNAPKRGLLRFGSTGSFDSVNPFIIKGSPAPGRHLVFESLLKRNWDEAFSLYGLIAESVQVPPDRSWVIFTLRPEARFHDGSPITVEDVIFSIKTLREKGRPNHRQYYSKVVDIMRTGPRQIKFTFGPKPDRELPLIMGLMPIISKKYYTRNDITKTTLEPPMGSGPYQINNVDPGRVISYNRVPDYWGTDLPINRGQNNFDEIRYDFFRDSNVAYEAFNAGEYDIRRESDPTKWANIGELPAIKLGRIETAELENSRPAGMHALAFNTRRPIFHDRRVRQALAYAFDFEWMNKTLFHGAYKRTSSFFVNSELAATGLPADDELAVLEPYSDQIPKEVLTKIYAPPATDGSGSARQNLQVARDILSEAGWKVVNNSLIHESTGQTMSFEILLVRSNNERVVLPFVRNLERLGITARVRTVDSAQYQARTENYDFDMVVRTWRVTLSPGNEQAFYWGSESADTPGTRNLAGVKDPVIDALIEKIVSAPDRRSLITRTRALDRVLLWGHYVIPLFYQSTDWVAYQATLDRPDITPIYGYVTEAWWSKE
jgi:microcin C transport system substrate-binding protein